MRLSSKLAVAALVMFAILAAPTIAGAQITQLTKWTVQTNKATLFTDAGKEMWLGAEAPLSGTKGNVRVELSCHGIRNERMPQGLTIRLIFAGFAFPVSSYVDDSGRVNYATDLLAKLNSNPTVKVGATVNSSGSEASFDSSYVRTGPLFAKEALRATDTLTIGFPANEHFAIILSFGGDDARRFLDSCGVGPYATEQ